ncbi:MAG: hypothetical protein EOO10_18070 [Chitinophagaceae bacterium]|nr:MAG: hypothetical protein EOO10_18070 [Chitinophagaceae bacterium]
MKFIAVSILIFLVATQAFSKWVMLLEFEWNQEYIAKNLCENKARPQMKCGGKCQLMKKMVAEEKESSPQSSTIKLKFQELVFSNDLSTNTPDVFSESKNISFLPYQLKKYLSPSPSIFHPPA